VLAGAAGRAAAHGGGLHVVCARDRTRRLFRLTGLGAMRSPYRDDGVTQASRRAATPGYRGPPENGIRPAFALRRRCPPPMPDRLSVGPASRHSRAAS
jgi:hypothetical protein